MAEELKADDSHFPRISEIAEVVAAAGSHVSVQHSFGLKTLQLPISYRKEIEFPT